MFTWCRIVLVFTLALPGCGRLFYDGGGNGGDLDADLSLPDDGAVPPDANLLNTFYVAPNGDDGNPGTLTEPFLTLQHAADVVVSGTQVLVQDGTYVGFSLIDRGSSDAPIVFRALGDSAVVNAPAPELDYGVNLRNVVNVVVEGFRVVDIPEHAIFVGADEISSNVTLRGNVVANCSQTGIQFLRTVDSLIVDNDVSDVGGRYVTVGGLPSDNLTFLRNNFHDAKVGNVSSGVYFGAADTGGAGTISGLEFSGNIVADIGGIGVAMDGVVTATLRNNYVHNVGRDGIVGYVSIGASPTSEMKYINNTVVAGQWALRLENTGPGSLAFNNLFFGNVLFGGGGRDTGYGSLSVDNAANLQSGYNGVEDEFSIGEAAQTFVQWQATNQGEMSVLMVPEDVLTLPAPQTPITQAGSDSEDAGASSFGGVVAPWNDFFNTERPAGLAFDIGAHEAP